MTNKVSGSEKMLGLFNIEDDPKEEIVSTNKVVEKKESQVKSNPLEIKKKSKITKTYAYESTAIDMLEEMERESGRKPGELASMAIKEFYERYMNNK